MNNGANATSPYKLLSVIMPTFNSAPYLERCLESLVAQTLDDWELICVDGGSTDETLSILEKYSLNWPQMRVLQGGRERTSQLNIGIRNSQSKYIYYTASDFDVDATLLEKATMKAETECADGVFLTNVSYGEGFWARVRNFERSMYPGTIKFEGVRFFLRSAYDKAGGYDDSIPIFEEYDLQDRMLKQGAKFARITDAVERHLGEPQTLLDIWSKSFYYGRQYRSFLTQRGATALRHINPARGVFFKHWRKFFRQPVLGGGFVIMLFVKYFAGAAGLVIETLLGNHNLA